MGIRTTKKETSVTITGGEFLKLLGLRVLYEQLSAERNRIMEAFADIVNLNDEEWYYDRGAYILQDNEGSGRKLKDLLSDADIKIVNGKKDNS